MQALPKNLPDDVNALLLLADGSYFLGRGFGSTGTVFGEICFNTAMTGYQEVMTDLSYAGQIICFTFPHIGNVGTNAEDIESNSPACKGLVVRENVTHPSNFRSLHHFEEWLEERGVTGISEVDTRALTQRIRAEGAQNVAIHFRKAGEAFDLEALAARLASQPSLEGADLAREVSTTQQYQWAQKRWTIANGYKDSAKADYHVVAVDYGEKLNILRSLAQFGCHVTVVPASTSAQEILGLKPDGVFLSNGPGDPAATAKHAAPVICAIVEAGVPLFGICLGHQMLALALGGKTEKMHQGHRGANHPVKNLRTGKVEITSQNHGFVVSENLPESIEVTHRSLFDGTIAGLAVKGKPVFSVQYHPESSPGPHDSLYLFEQFVAMMSEAKGA